MRPSDRSIDWKAKTKHRREEAEEEEEEEAKWRLDTDNIAGYGILCLVTGKAKDKHKSRAFESIRAGICSEGACLAGRRHPLGLSAVVFLFSPSVRFL